MTFAEKIKKFNELYNMPKAGEFNKLARLMQFKNILQEEVAEVYEFSEKYLKTGDATELEVDVADWLGDVMVYCASEAQRWGMDFEKILDIIMESNFSKMGADGLPIYDERKKLLKGPNYWAPEAKLRSLLMGNDK